MGCRAEVNGRELCVRHLSLPSYLHVEDGVLTLTREDVKQVIWLMVKKAKSGAMYKSCTWASESKDDSISYQHVIEFSQRADMLATLMSWLGNDANTELVFS